MIQVIKDALYCHLPGYDECPDFIAETVMQSIEGGNKFQKGMQPPFNHEAYSKTWRDGGSGYEWDKESDI